MGGGDALIEFKLAHTDFVFVSVVRCYVQRQVGGCCGEDCVTFENGKGWETPLHAVAMPAIFTDHTEREPPAEAWFVESALLRFV